ncbi:MAG: hypothetical protein KJ077_32900 [Anaerolineae bacterium]|nr:hypothetical protein [Anaerolineae bacterium]
MIDVESLSKEFNPKKAKVLYAFSKGCHCSGAAALAGVNRCTITRWLSNDPKFEAAVAKVLKDYVEMEWKASEVIREKCKQGQEGTFVDEFGQTWVCFGNGCYDVVIVDPEIDPSFLHKQRHFRYKFMDLHN